MSERYIKYMERRSKETDSMREKVLFIIGRLITLIQIVISVITIVLLKKAGLLPDKYVILAGVVLAALIVVFALLMKRKIRIVRFIAGLVLSVLVSAGLVYADLKLYELTSTLQTITDTTEETTRVGVYVLEDDPAQSIEDMPGYTFGILETQAREETDNVISQIDDALGTQIATEPYADAAELADALLDGECGAIILNEGFVDMITETEGYEDFESQIREVAYYEWQTAITGEDTGETGDPINEDGIFTMYISGIDTYGSISARSRSDVNILAVVNTNTRQVLLVSTPRDYYVPLSISGGVKDKLTHAGIYGVTVSKDTLAMLYDIDIDYYFRINFSGFEQLIDALGGITVQSDYTFDVEPSFHYEEGANYLNGEEALAFARERYSFAEGDRQRGRNQMAVITGVINKLMSPSILRNFSDLMEGLEGSFESDLSYDDLAGLVKTQLAEGGSWNIVTYSVDGTGTRASTYSMSGSLYVMEPDQSTVDHAKELISQVENGETLEQE